MPETLSHVHPTLPTIQRKSNGKATGRAEMLPCTDGQYDFAKLDFGHLGGVGEDVGELSVNCGWGFSIVGVQPRQWNSSVGQPQHEVRRFRYVSNCCTKSSLRDHFTCPSPKAVSTLVERASPIKGVQKGHPQDPQTGHTWHKSALSGPFIGINLRFCTGHIKRDQKRNSCS